MTDIIGKVFEVRLYGDENFYPLGIFYDEDEANRIAAQGNAVLDKDPKSPYPKFTVVTQDVIANTGDWTVEDFRETFENVYDVDDYFILGDME